MRLFADIIIFLVGAALGVWWGVYHPVQAAHVADVEQRTEQKIVDTAHNLAQRANTPPPAPAPAPSH